MTVSSRKREHQPDEIQSACLLFSHNTYSHSILNSRQRTWLADSMRFVRLRFDTFRQDKVCGPGMRTRGWCGHLPGLLLRWKGIWKT